LKRWFYLSKRWRSSYLFACSVLVSLLHAPVVTARFIVNISLYKVSYYATTDDNIMSSGTDIGTLK